jgi:hypothetical protein
MPRGLVNSKERDPTNFTHAEWEQAKRTGHDLRTLKSMFQECWAASDSREAFTAAIQARGYTLARGDRRGYVAVDYRGEVYAIAKYAGIKTREVRDRLGNEKNLPSIDQAKIAISARMTGMLRRNIQEIETCHRLQSASFAFRRNQIVQRQREERARLEKDHAVRWEKEMLERTQSLSTGFKGIWDRLTGRYAEIRRQNEFEALKGMQRDRTEKDALIFRPSGRKAGPASSAGAGQAGTHEAGRKSAPGCCRVYEDGWKRAAKPKVTFPDNQFGAKPSGTDI